MKELTKKLIEAGLVNKTTVRLLQSWGSLPPEEVEQLTPKRVMTETLATFLEELELLLQPEVLERETTELEPSIFLNDCKKGY